jgi:hypothetical protein
MLIQKPRIRVRPSSAAGWLVGVVLICTIITGTACKMSQTAEPPVTKSNPEVKRVLGYFRPVEGTSYLMAPITSGSGSSYSSSSNYDSGNQANNYVFVNSADESTLTLLPTNDHLFVGTVSIPEKPAGEKEPLKVQWFLYGLVKVDTNADKELTHKDRRSLCVSDAGGAGFKELILEVDEVYGHSLRDADTLIVIYRKASKKYLTRISLASREAVSTRELPDFGVVE